MAEDKLSQKDPFLQPLVDQKIDAQGCSEETPLMNTIFSPVAKGTKAQRFLKRIDHIKHLVDFLQVEVYSSRERSECKICFSITIMFLREKFLEGKPQE